jgi:hypothetical protein
VVASYLAGESKEDGPPAEPKIMAAVASTKLASDRKEPAERTRSPTPRLDQRIK